MRHPLLLLAWMLLLGSCVAPGAHPAGSRPTELGYEVRYLVGAARLEVRITLPPDAPRYFLFTEPAAKLPLTVRASGRAPRVLLPDSDGEVTLDEEDLEIAYSVPLDREGSFVTGTALEDGAVIAGRAYLLRPRAAREGRPVRLRVLGAPALLPWATVAEGDYRLQEEDLVDSGFHTFGGRRCREEISGSSLEIALVGPPPRAGDAALCAWLDQAAEEVLTLRSPFPFPRVAVSLVLTPSETAAGFGMVLWSDPPSLAIHAGALAAPEDFDDDWVAVHELLHLTHPTFLRRARWLSEGLATYYTDVVRMRSGRSTAEQGWASLADGFRRGRADGGPRTLEALSLSEGGLGYVGYYWGGALTLLELDVAIRRATKGARSLDDVLTRLGSAGIVSSPENFAQTVDALVGGPLWSELVEPRLKRPSCEGAEETLRRLGVELSPGSEVLLREDAPDSSIRKAITHLPTSQRQGARGRGNP